MRFSQLTQTKFALVPMGGTFYVPTVPDASKMAELARCTKTRLRARKLAEVQADPNSLITVAVDDEGRRCFVGADDVVYVAKGSDDDAPENCDDSGNGQNDRSDAGG